MILFFAIVSNFKVVRDFYLIKWSKRATGNLFAIINCHGICTWWTFYSIACSIQRQGVSAIGNQGKPIAYAVGSGA